MFFLFRIKSLFISLRSKWAIKGRLPPLLEDIRCHTLMSPFSSSSHSYLPPWTLPRRNPCCYLQHPVQQHSQCLASYIAVLKCIWLKCYSSRLHWGTPLWGLVVSLKYAKNWPGRKFLVLCSGNQILDETMYPFPSQSSPVHSTIG